MSTLQGKKIVVIGGSSGIGYGVAKASLLSLADHVTIASSSRIKVDSAIARLLADPALQQQGFDLNGRLAGDVADLQNTESVRAFLNRVGEVDHLVITAGPLPSPVNIREDDLNKLKGPFYFNFQLLRHNQLISSC